MSPHSSPSSIPLFPPRSPHSHLPVHRSPLPSSSSPPHSHLPCSPPLPHSCLPHSPPHFHLLTDYTVYSAAAPSGGPLLLFFLNTLDTYSLLPTDSTHNLTYHRLVEVFKYGFALRTQLGDPNCDRCGDIREQVLATQATMIKYVTCYERLKPGFVNLIFVVIDWERLGVTRSILTRSTLTRSTCHEINSHEINLSRDQLKLISWLTSWSRGNRSCENWSRDTESFSVCWSRDTESFSVCWSHDKLILWELILWQVDLVAIDLVKGSPEKNRPTQYKWGHWKYNNPMQAMNVTTIKIGWLPCRANFSQIF